MSGGIAAILSEEGILLAIATSGGDHGGPVPGTHTSGSRRSDGFDGRVYGAGTRKMKPLFRGWEGACKMSYPVQGHRQVQDPSAAIRAKLRNGDWSV